MIFALAIAWNVLAQEECQVKIAWESWEPFQDQDDEMTRDHLHYAKLVAHRIDGFLAEPMVSMIELRKKGG